MKGIDMRILALAVFTILGACGGGPPGAGGGGGSTCATCDAVTPDQAVILVHGRNDTPARWDGLVSTWSTEGYVEGTNLFRIDMATYCGDNGFCSMLGSPDGDGATYVNESYAKCLARYIDEQVPSGTVDIVAHSQGGIVARYYARFLAPAGRVDTIVAMSSPLNGIINCTLAGACGGVNPEVCPDSAFLHALNGVAPEGDGSNDETPAGARYASVVSDKDNVISPWCSAHFILNPDSMQGDDLDCRRTNYDFDTEAASCQTDAQHLVIPTDAAAIEFAYCRVNAP